MSALVQDNMRGLIISQRPDEIKTTQKNRIMPFNSTFPIGNPTGYNPTTKPVTLYKNQPKKLNQVVNRNQQLINKLVEAKKIRESLTKNDLVSMDSQIKKRKKKLASTTTAFYKQKKLMEDIRKEVHDEVYKDDAPQSQDKNEKLPNLGSTYQNKGSTEENLINNYFVNPIKTESINENINKINSSQKPKWCLTKQEAEEMGDKEVDELINFAKTLDYQKYLKNIEIREALYLIKNKVEKDNEFGVDKIEEMEGVGLKEENEMVGNPMEKEIRERMQLAIENQMTKNPEKPQSKPVVHNQEWDTTKKLNLESLPKISNEITKKNIAEEMYKTHEGFKTVHSVQSVKKMLERGGVFSGDNNNNLLLNQNDILIDQSNTKEGKVKLDPFPHKNPFINVKKDRQPLFNYPKYGSDLPFLHEYPAV